MEEDKNNNDNARWGPKTHTALLAAVLQAWEHMHQEFNKAKQEAEATNNYKLLADFKVHDSHYKEVILESLNAAGLPGPQYTWEATRKVTKASIHFFCRIVRVRFALKHPPFRYQTTTSSLPSAAHLRRYNHSLSGIMEKNQKWGPEAHVTLISALLAAMDQANVRPTDHKESILDVFKAKGLDDFTWEGIRYYFYCVFQFVRALFFCC
jgi:hypothetical protein